MSARLQHVHEVVEQVVRDSELPGAIVALAEGNGPVEYVVTGTDAAGVPLAADSLLPVASVTKLATALAALRLVADGAFSLDDELARHLPDAAAAQPGVTIRRLLSHTAGLPADVPPGVAPYDLSLSWGMLRDACLATPPDTTPGSYLRYCNLGPGLVAIIIERITGQTISEAINDLVLGPLGVEGYLGVEPPRTPARVGGALGEHEGDELEPYNSAFYRGLGLPWGGMVATAGCALALARAFAGEPSGFLSPELLADATRDQAGGVPGIMGGFREWERASWGIGVEVHGGKMPQFAPRAASPESFGHSGHSGCLAWHDPQINLTWFTHCLLTPDRSFRASLKINTAVVEG